MAGSPSRLRSASARTKCIPCSVEKRESASTMFSVRNSRIAAHDPAASIQDFDFGNRNHKASAPRSNIRNLIHDLSLQIPWQD